MQQSLQRACNKNEDSGSACRSFTPFCCSCLYLHVLLPHGHWQDSKGDIKCMWRQRWHYPNCVQAPISRSRTVDRQEMVPTRKRRRYEEITTHLNAGSRSTSLRFSRSTYGWVHRLERTRQALNTDAVLCGAY